MFYLAPMVDKKWVPVQVCNTRSGTGMESQLSPTSILPTHDDDYRTKWLPLGSA